MVLMIFFSLSANHKHPNDMEKWLITTMNSTSFVILVLFLCVVAAASERLCDLLVLFLYACETEWMCDCMNNFNVVCVRARFWYASIQWNEDEFEIKIFVNKLHFVKATIESENCLPHEHCVSRIAMQNVLLNRAPFLWCDFHFFLRFVIHSRCIAGWSFNNVPCIYDFDDVIILYGRIGVTFTIVLPLHFVYIGYAWPLTKDDHFIIIYFILGSQFHSFYEPVLDWSFE